MNNLEHLQKAISPILKAVSIFLIGLAGFLAVVIPLISDGTVSLGDGVAIVGALGTWLGGTSAVYSLPNREL